MKSENLIHIKLEHSEAVQSKRDILSSEMNLIRILRITKKYHSIRDNELDKKLMLLKKIRELKMNIGKLQITLPKVKIPNILKENEEKLETKSIKEKVEKSKIKDHDNDLEYQLREIQEKLRSLH